MQQDFRSRLYGAIESNLENPDFGADQLSHILGMSHSKLLRNVRNLTGKSITQLIREIRLEKARELIQEHGVNVSEAAFKTGFNSAAYFSTRFHEFYGYPPGEIIKNQYHGHEPGPAAMPATPGKKRMPLRRMILIGSGLLVLGILIISIFIALTGNARQLLDQRIATQERTIAILPFENLSQDTITGIMCNFFRAELQTLMTRMDQLQVRSLLSNQEYASLEGSAQKIAKATNSNYLIMGQMATIGNQFKIWVHLNESESSLDIWTYDTVALQTDLLQVLRDITRSVANELKIKTGTVEKPEAVVQAKGTKNQEAIFFKRQGDIFLSSETRNSLKSALLCYEKAIQEDSLWATPYLDASLALIELWWTYTDRNPAVLDKCKRYLETAELLNPDSGQLFIKWGDFYWRCIPDFPKALKYFDKVQELEPEGYGSPLMHGNVYRVMGEWEKAIESYQTAIDKAAGSATWYYAAETLRMMHRYEESEHYLDLLINHYPQIIQVYWQKALVQLYGRGDPVKCLEILDGGSRLNYYFNNDSMVNEIRVMAELCLGHFHKAEEYLDQSEYVVFQNQFFFRPKELYYAWADEIAGNVIESQAHYLKALKVMEPYFKQFPDDPRLFSAQGMVLAGLGDRQRAVESGQKARRLLPITKDATRGINYVEDLAWTFMKLGLYSDAMSMLTIVFSHPGNLTPSHIRMNPLWKPILRIPEYEEVEKQFSEL
jgi:AraC-like DNA-binding protein/tetratricopeptide (TPR) repeat protein